MCSMVPLHSYYCKRSKSFCNLVSSGITTGRFSPWICSYIIYRKYKLSWHDQTEQANPSWHGGMVNIFSIISPQTPFNTKVLAFYAFFFTPIISAEAPCYRLISKPGAWDVSPLLLLLCWANKKGIRQKS